MASHASFSKDIGLIKLIAGKQNQSVLQSWVSRLVKNCHIDYVPYLGIQNVTDEQILDFRRVIWHSSKWARTKSCKVQTKIQSIQSCYILKEHIELYKILKFRVNLTNTEQDTAIQKLQNLLRNVWISGQVNKCPAIHTFVSKFLSFWMAVSCSILSQLQRNFRIL